MTSSKGSHYQVDILCVNYLLASYLQCAVSGHGQSDQIEAIESTLVGLTCSLKIPIDNITFYQFLLVWHFVHKNILILSF